MDVAQEIYDRTPVPFQNLMTSASGFHKNLTRYGAVYWRHRRWLASYDRWSLARKLEHQEYLLQRFLAYATNNSAFYADLYTEIDIDGIRSREDLMLLPVVGKEDLRKNALTARTIPERGAVEAHTGGTTGKSLVVLMHPADQMRRMATLDHFKSKAGFENLKMRRATFMGKHIIPPGGEDKNLWRYNAASRQMLYSSFHLTEDNLGRYVASLNDFRPRSLDGFFTSMVDVASFILRKGVKLDFRPLAAFPTSETITPEGRRIIEEAFATKVYDQYASSEGAPFVTECIAGTLHVDPQSGVFEHRYQDTSEVLVTSFTTHGTPLIRYAIGDSMVFGPDKTCSCGVASPTVESIEGRRDDFLYTSEGAKINGGNVANLFKNMPNVLIRAQAVQETMDEVKLLLEVDETLYTHDHDDLLREEFRRKFGRGTALVIEHVDLVPREASGKLRLIKNNVVLPA